VKILFSFCLLLAAAAPAAAADLSEASPGYGKPAPAAIVWTGFYTGVQGGYGWGSTSHSFDNGAPSGNSRPSGWLGGVHAGYNFQMGRMVTGLEGDIEGAGLSGSFVNTSGFTSTGSARMSWDASLRARFGAAFGPSLPYLTGGVAFAGYKFAGGPTFLPLCCSYSATLTGWTAGGGWDYAINRYLIWRIEYRYTDYGKASGGLPPSFPGTKMPTNSTTSVVRVGLSYKY
jgi:outer membrane immunogenic protein